MISQPTRKLILNTELWKTLLYLNALSSSNAHHPSIASPSTQSDDLHLDPTRYRVLPQNTTDSQTIRCIQGISPISVLTARMNSVKSTQIGKHIASPFTSPLAILLSSLLYPCWNIPVMLLKSFHTKWTAISFTSDTPPIPFHFTAESPQRILRPFQPFCCEKHSTSSLTSSFSFICLQNGLYDPFNHHIAFRDGITILTLPFSYCCESNGYPIAVYWYQ